jgi:hypothetical protein
VAEDFAVAAVVEAAGVGSRTRAFYPASAPGGEEFGLRLASRISWVGRPASLTFGISRLLNIPLT